MDEKSFLQAFNEQKEYLKAWGDYVKQSIEERLERIDIIKIPITPRIKDDNSILNKAFYRGKNYENPLLDITDKVGLRVVVLLLEEISIIGKIIENTSAWSSSKDRDFEKEKEEDPALFQYQSVHYVVRNKNTFEFNGVKIPQDTPCEIQIRTLLQHSYSELTHDTIYKSTKKRKSDIYRLLARSMALIETTDSIFKEVNSEMNKEDSILKDILPLIKKKYSEIAEPHFDEYIFSRLKESYENEFDILDVDDFKEFINSEDFNGVIYSIKKNYNENLIFRQPIIILLFYLVENYEIKTRKNWPFTEDKLEPIYIGLGKSFDKD
ncbi:hypothetical protein [Clostridium perfringens]|uniref:hypothetical protein n=1 Tax=Clostridium perfringens TaxID=1502 RepID=UPI00351141EF|nr:RelA/SpoT domain-containing protein [Clostridium perfringens]